MTENELKASNPWVEVANMLNPEESDCLYREQNKDWYVCSKDKERIIDFNKKCDKDKDYANCIITNTPPEPWKGNPLHANVIVLSLNPGFSPEINETLAKLLQSNETIRKGLIEFRRQTLLLEEDSFLPTSEWGSPISIKEAEDMLQGWYWSKRFKRLIQDSKMEELDVYKRIALIEFHGYSSASSGKSFPIKRKGSASILSSQQFIKDMVSFIAKKPDDEVCFIIVRSQNKWNSLLEEIWDKSFFSNKRILKDNNGRGQSITPENIGKGNYDRVLNILKRTK